MPCTEILLPSPFNVNTITYKFTWSHDNDVCIISMAKWPSSISLNANTFKVFSRYFRQAFKSLWSEILQPPNPLKGCTEILPHSISLHWNFCPPPYLHHPPAVNNDCSLIIEIHVIGSELWLYLEQPIIQKVHFKNKSWNKTDNTHPMGSAGYCILNG